MTAPPSRTMRPPDVPPTTLPNSMISAPSSTTRPALRNRFIAAIFKIAAACSSAVRHDHVLLGCSASSWWRGPLHRRQLGHGAHKSRELRSSGREIAETAPCRNVESHGEDQVCHAWSALHQQIGRSLLECVRHALAASRLMCQNRGRTFIFGSAHLAPPNANAFAHTPRRELEPLVSPVRLASGIVETRLAIQAIQIGADDLAVLHAGP